MPIPLIAWLIGGGVALLLGGCAKPREREETDDPDHIYKTIKPILDENCVSCHEGDEAAGNYDLSTYVKRTEDGRYRGIVGYGTNTIPNAIAGNPYSRILTILRQGDHSTLLTENERATLTHWVTHDRLARFWISGIHTPGWLNPVDPDFHGEDLAQNNWDLAECRDCHGEEGEVGGAYGGGKVTVGFGDRVQSCIQCHDGSPEGCTTCHGRNGNPAPPKPLRWEGSLGAGAHASHLEGSEIAEPTPCEECHIVPQGFSDPSHIDAERPAEVNFSGLALYNGYEPVWGRDSASCSNVYCHQQGEPVWTILDGSQKTCTSCHNEHSHGVQETQCSLCHGKVVNAAKEFPDRSLHVNGSREIGPQGKSPESVTCLDCHDIAGEGGPPRGLDWEGSFGVAAHRTHLESTLISPPIGCDECHNVPDTLHAAGHIGGALPAEVPFPEGSRARLNGRNPSWDRTSGTCGTTYCHSPSGNQPSPVWNDPTVVTNCNSCHGAPPPPPHPQFSPDVVPCATCHANEHNIDGMVQ